MVIRSTALQSALAGMTAAHNQLAGAAQNLAKPLLASPAESSSAGTEEGTSAEAQDSATQSMSEDYGRSLLTLHEALTASRVNLMTADAAQGMLDDLLEIGRR